MLETLIIILNLLTVLSLLAGLFFMFMGALGLWRLPDIYHRMHAATKCITLGIAGLLLASVLHLSTATPGVPHPDAPAPAVVLAGETPTGASAPPAHAARAGALGAITKALLVLVFQFVAAPVGAHMLARAAHMAKVKQWEGTLSDELAEHHEEKQ